MPRARFGFMDCPCGSRIAYDDCCGRFHGGAPVPTAQALMRARYSAFALGKTEFLLATGTQGSAAALAESLSHTRWLRLEVESAEQGQPNDPDGFVTFKAYFQEAGGFAVLAERSRFERRSGNWHYVDGTSQVTPLALGRNDACPCGRGKKVKACHGS